MIEDDLILKLENFIPHDVCDFLVNRWNEDLSEKESYSSNKGLVHNSSYDIMNIGEIEEHKVALNICLDIIDNARNIWLKNMRENYVPKTIERHTKYIHYIRMMRYAKGSKIDIHTDHGNPAMIHGSVTLNLNDSYSGGDFSFFGGDKKITLAKGDVLIFPASCFFTHEVEEITEGERYSVNSFLSAYPKYVEKSIKEVLQMYMDASGRYEEVL